MARIKNFPLKATQTRKRVQKYRKLRKLRKMYDRLGFEPNLANNIGDLNSNTTSEEFSNNTFSLNDEMRLWATEHRITKAAINDLLSILITAGFSYLPKDSRTLMETPKKVEIYPLGSGKMWYYGLKKCLNYVFTKVRHDISIHLDFNFDGMQLFNSSKLTFWPMLAAIQGTYNIIILL